MNIPDLPAGFALPAVDPAAALTVLFAALLGTATADVVATLRPFARRRTSRIRALLGLVALVAGCLVFGASVDRDETVLVASAVGAVLGLLGYWMARLKLGQDSDAGTTDVLSDAELRRDKTGSDRWVLVTGLAGSGKTSLVGEMIAAAPTRLAGPVRNAEDGALRVTEVAVQDPMGGVGLLRIWEAAAVGDGSRRLPPLDEFDASVLTIDPAQHAPIADSFPDVLRGGRSPVDANASVLQLAGSMRGNCLVWGVATKADLLRFSVHPKLLDLPLQPGPGWYRQVRNMDVMARRELAEMLELDQLTREHEPAFAWGTGSPFFVYLGGSNGRQAFGGGELMNAMLEALWPGWGP